LQKENVMGHFSKKAIACRFARDLGFDYAHRAGLFGKQALYVADIRWYHRREKGGLIGLPLYIVVEGGKARQLNTDETMDVLCGRA
jgi:hypothetical protein